MTEQPSSADIRTPRPAATTTAVSAHECVSSWSGMRGAGGTAHRRNAPRAGRATTRAPLPGSAAGCTEAGAGCGTVEAAGRHGQRRALRRTGLVRHGRQPVVARRRLVALPALPVAPGVLGLQRYRRPAQRLVRRPRQRQPELRTAARLAPRLQPAAVQPGVLHGDGQPEAGTAGGTRPRRVGPPEAVEDPGRLAGLEPDPVVAHGDGDRAARPRASRTTTSRPSPCSTALTTRLRSTRSTRRASASAITGCSSPTTTIRRALALGERLGTADHPAHDRRAGLSARPPAPPRPRRTG